MARDPRQERLMHEQAFHTCCKRGLTAQPGFQFNAVSAGLTGTSLDRLASAHAGYHAPRDTPAEPTHEQLGVFPLGLRHQPVEGFGDVVSRTAYVGREFRGHGGEPDTGRFGNYFTHILVGDGGPEPFDGLLPIELWDAEHWTTEESSDPVLEPIGALIPGPLDLDRALSILLPDGAPWIGEIVSATASALYGGPRVVLIDEPGERAAAWVALVSFSLPRSLASTLSFSTFEGRPRYVDLQLALSTPTCDVAFPAYELGHKVTLIDTIGGAPDPNRQTLLGRVIEALAELGGEALSGMVRALDAEDHRDVASLAAASALLAGRVDLAENEAEVVMILQLIAEWHRAGRGVGSLAAAAQGIATREDAATDATFASWEALHAVCRDGGHPESAEILDVVLEQLIGDLERIDPAGPPVRCDTAVRPTMVRLAEFVDRLLEPLEPDRTSRRIAAGWQLGLVGLNDELDRRLSVALVDHLESEIARRTFTAIAASPRHRELVTATVAVLLERATNDQGALAILVELGGQEVVEEAMNNAIRVSDSFEVWFVGAQVQLPRYPQRRKPFITRLAGLACTERHADALRRLYGPSGPTDVEQHIELLDAYGAASRSVPAQDLDAAWRTVLSVPFDDPQSAALAPLVQALIDANPQAEREAGYVAWRAAAEQPRGNSGPRLGDWMGQLEYVVLRPPEELPRARYAELLEIAVWLVLRCEDPEEHRACFAQAVSLLGQNAWIRACHSALGHKPSDDARTLARLFEIWTTASAEYDTSHRLALGTLLPAVVKTWSPRQRGAIERALPKSHLDAWLEWNELYPPSRAITRTVGRLRRRGEERR